VLSPTAVVVLVVPVPLVLLLGLALVLAMTLVVLMPFMVLVPFLARELGSSLEGLDYIVGSVDSSKVKK
jgi:hypothetical protein